MVTASVCILLADYAISARSGTAHAVHTFVLDAAGEWVIVDFQNSHQPDFRRIRPASREDCSELAVVRVASYLR